MDAASYEAWYASPRGHWVGTAEYRLLGRQLRARAGETLLDIGCGTGWFTRCFAAQGLTAAGLDIRSDWLAFARSRSENRLQWVAGDAQALPFADGSFDHVVSIAALCFVEDERGAVAEAVRVARQRFAIGWLHRGSLLYREKGCGGGSGAYQGARWHDKKEVRDLFSDLPVRDLAVHSAIVVPSGGLVARLAEHLLPRTLPLGALIVVSGAKSS